MLVQSVPLPHHVPEHAGGVSFRFAMVEDVLHERLAKHGTAYYQERVKRDRKKLDEAKRGSKPWFDHADDLGVGLERLGRSAEGAEILRDKLQEQQKAGLTGRELYSTYANLGTFLIHDAFKGTMAGDETARQRFKEGLELVRKSVEVNPQAHFGRERWQVAIAEFLLACSEDPSLLKRFDCLGNRLDLRIEQILDREEDMMNLRYGRAVFASFGRDASSTCPEYFRPGVSPEDPNNWPKLKAVREFITTVGVETHEASPPPVFAERAAAPFDEPVLGIIGMWREGGGASPHFALALGEVMLRVGQRYLAWAAFERASRLADKYSADPSVQEFLREHCRSRQAAIVTTFAYRPPNRERRRPWQKISPPRPGDTPENLRAQFDQGLKKGEDFQKRFQQYEAARLAEGASIDDPHFHEAFQRSEPPIASRPGPEEWYRSVPEGPLMSYLLHQFVAAGTLGAGVAAMITALLARKYLTGHATPSTPKPDTEWTSAPL